jgi:DNA invertase Pin-like site-specific DNA recombinase
MGYMELAVGYTTFPERKRAVSPESRYQARKIEATCQARGIDLRKLVGDVESHPGPDLKRPGLSHALELLDAGEVTCLVVTSLDRLTASPATLGTLIDWLEERNVRFVVVDIDLDTSTAEGQLAARALAHVGGIERARNDHQGGGLVLAFDRNVAARRPAVSDHPQLKRRIVAMRESGMTLQAIADTLNAEGVPTLRGGQKWRPSSVQAATGYQRPGRNAKPTK